MARSIPGAKKRTLCQARRLGRWLERLDVRERDLVPQCPVDERIGVSLRFTEREEVVLEQIAAFYGLNRTQWLRGLAIAAMKEHLDRMAAAQELGYGQPAA